MTADEYNTMREISGSTENPTSHSIGRVLANKGYRCSDGSPTASSIEKGLAQPYRLECGRIAYKWRRSFVLSLLKAE